MRRFFSGIFGPELVVSSQIMGAVTVRFGIHLLVISWPLDTGRRRATIFHTDRANRTRLSI